MTPEMLIDKLGLAPHPEGGRYAETYRAPAPQGERAAVTAIYFLLRAGERSHWHKVDATEIWLWHAGHPLELSLSDGRTAADRCVLGLDLAGGEQPQRVVPAHHWQSARSLGAWTLVSCIVAPGFEFAGFELAPDGFEPGGRG